MKTRDIARYGMLAAVMLVLGYIEHLFVLVPGIPGIKLGLSNTVLLYAVCLMNAKGALVLMVVKVVLSALLFGGVTGFFYSLAGGILSLCAMIPLSYAKGFGLPGISVAGAALHMTGQVLMSRLLLGSWAALSVAPYLLIAAAVTGALTGVIAQMVCVALSHTDKLVRQRMTQRGWIKQKKDGEDGI